MICDNSIFQTAWNYVNIRPMNIYDGYICTYINLYTMVHSHVGDIIY